MTVYYADANLNRFRIPDCAKLEFDIPATSEHHIYNFNFAGFLIGYAIRKEPMGGIHVRRIERLIPQISLGSVASLAGSVASTVRGWLPSFPFASSSHVHSE